MFVRLALFERIGLAVRSSDARTERLALETISKHVGPVFNRSARLYYDRLKTGPTHRDRHRISS